MAKIEMQMPNFTYRVLEPEHAKVWQKLWLEGAGDFPMGFLLTVEEINATSPERCREILAQRGIRGVFDDEKLAGFCGYRPQRLARIRHRAEIGPFFIVSDYQGSGAAQVLIAGVIQEAESSGISQLELYVDTGNHRAVAFYERQGFERVAIHRDSVRIDGVSRDDLFMTRRL